MARLEDDNDNLSAGADGSVGLITRNNVRDVGLRSSRVQGLGV